MAELIFDECNLLTSKGFSEFFSSNTNLSQCKSLEIAGCKYFDDESLKALLTLPVLKILKNFKLFSLNAEFSFSLKKFIFHECLVDEHMIAKYISPIKNCLI